MAMLPGQDIFDLSCVIQVVPKCGHLVSQNECTPRWLSRPMQIQSEVVAHGLPDAGALMPVDDRQGASAQGILGAFNGSTCVPLCTLAR